MGHVVFLLLHIAAALLLWPLLFLTLPLHLIYAGTKRPGTSFWTHVRCPRCRNEISKQASVCTHCGCELVPKA